MNCPHCEGPLQTGPNNPDVAECAECGLGWIDRETLDQIFESLERRFHLSSLEELRKECDARQKEMMASGSARYLNCPECDQPMVRRSFMQVSFLMTQACLAHGVLLRLGDLPKMIDFVVRGGERIALEAQADALQKQLDNASGRAGKKEPRRIKLL